MITTQTVYFQYGMTVWWLVSRYYEDSGYTSSYQFKLAIETVNPQIFGAKGAWASVQPGDPIYIPMRT